MDIIKNDLVPEKNIYKASVTMFERLYYNKVKLFIYELS
jgi:hypothetical protein